MSDWIYGDSWKDHGDRSAPTWVGGTGHANSISEARYVKLLKLKSLEEKCAETMVAVAEAEEVVRKATVSLESKRNLLQLQQQNVRNCRIQ